MAFNLQNKFYICVCALIAYIPNHSTRILQGNSWTERSVLKIIVHFVAVCQFDASKVVFMFNNHQVTLKFTQKLVSELFWVSIIHNQSNLTAGGTRPGVRCLIWSTTLLLYDAEWTNRLWADLQQVNWQWMGLFKLKIPRGWKYEKTWFFHMRTTKPQISLSICAVWSAPLLFTAWIV